MPSRIKPGKDEILYVPLGGAGEIGMNMYAYGHAGKWILVDCGISFAHDGIPGIELLMPDPDFILAQKDALLGLVVTHAHEDHIGAIAYIIEELDCPIYATRFTAAMIRTRLDENDHTRKTKIHIIEPRQDFPLGPFGLRYVPLTHSIPDNCALLITTAIGKIFHSGDWKFDPAPGLGAPADKAELQAIGQSGVLAMTCDSTNVFEPGQSGSEAAVAKSLRQIIATQTGKVAVTLFASNLARVQSIIEAAIANDRQVVLAGRSLHRVYGIGVQLNIIPEYAAVLDEDDAGYIPDDKILYLCTGCQGERRSAMAKIAARDHPRIRLGRGDSVIFSSREIPGNEIAIQQMQNALVRQGVKLITAQESFTHVSGHPYRGELVEMYQLIRPRTAIPMHGELRHLTAHQELARECQVPQAVIVENGQLLRLTADGHELLPAVKTGVLALDGEQWIALDSNIIKEKQKLNWHGAMAISVVLDGGGTLAALPQISLLGISHGDDAEAMIEAVTEAIEAALGKLSKAERKNDQLLAEKIRQAAQRVLTDITGKKPLGKVHILRV